MIILEHKNCQMEHGTSSIFLFSRATNTVTWICYKRNSDTNLEGQQVQGDNHKFCWYQGILTNISLVYSIHAQILFEPSIFSPSICQGDLVQRPLSNKCKELGLLRKLQGPDNVLSKNALIFHPHGLSTSDFWGWKFSDTLFSDSFESEGAAGVCNTCGIGDGIYLLTRGT